MQPFDLIYRLEHVSALDAVISPVQKFFRQYVQPQRLRDLLHGVPIGHPAHPPMVQLPIGLWLSAVALDHVPGAEQGADALVGMGILAAVPAAASGVTDWSELNPRPARVGAVHALANSVGLVLFAGSLAARRSGHRGLGRGLALLGISSVGVGGVLGGHLSFAQASGANHVADMVDRVPADWQAVGTFADLPEGQPVNKLLGEVPLLVVRDGLTARVLANRCGHLSGPLSDGELTGSGAEQCVVCPWHGSTFRLVDGSVVHGPATAPQPAFDVRVRAGALEVRLRP